MLDELIESLKQSGIKAYGLESLNLICLYDDDYYSNIDYDFVSNQHRSLLRVILIKLGWSAKSSRIFSKGEHEVLFPKPTGVLGTDPSDSVSSEFKENRFIFSTPSQAFLIMAKSDKWDQSKACDMVLKCPANIDKVYQWMKEYRLTAPTKEQLAEIKTIQAQEFQKKVLARKKSGF